MINGQVKKIGGYGEAVKRIIGMWPALLYLLWFAVLEKLIPDKGSYLEMHCFVDDLIPFSEIFIIPYLLWFPMMGFVFVFFMFSDKKDYNNMRRLVVGGMLLCLLVCTLVPNGQHLRPAALPDNFFGSLVQHLYSTDTCTNVCPSVHVYNSAAGCAVIFRSRAFSKNTAVKTLSLVMTILISLSTMFLKQHSFIDVAAALVLLSLLYIIVYRADVREIFSKKRAERKVEI